MAFVYVSEFASLGNDAGGRVMEGIPQTPPIAEQQVAITAGSVASAAFNSATKFILVHTDAICSIAFGASPTAVATAARMAAGETRRYAVVPGQKIAVITNT